MSNYKIVSTKNEPRVELKEALNLSGCELSINELPANASVPFVHSHKQNEELYLVLKGGGTLFSSTARRRRSRRAMRSASIRRAKDASRQARRG